MKHIQSINEWFGKKSDKPNDEVRNIFENIIKMIKNNDINIRFEKDIYHPKFGDYYLSFNDKKYIFSIIAPDKKCFLSICNRNKSIKSFIIWDEENNFEIPRKYYNAIAEIYEEQLKEEIAKRQIDNIEKSDVGQDAKKYNL